MYVCMYVYTCQIFPMFRYFPLISIGSTVFSCFFAIFDGSAPLAIGVSGAAAATTRQAKPYRRRLWRCLCSPVPWENRKRGRMVGLFVGIHGFILGNSWVFDLFFFLRMFGKYLWRWRMMVYLCHFKMVNSFEFWKIMGLLWQMMMTMMTLDAGGFWEI